MVARLPKVSRGYLTKIAPVTDHAAFIPQPQLSDGERMDWINFSDHPVEGARNIRGLSASLPRRLFMHAIFVL